MNAPLIRVENLMKSYRQGFWMRRVDAVNGISFTVPDGEIFGFLGPNGAGKTTTIKVLAGLIAATGGEATMFGYPVTDVRARRQLGFLPENPYIYPYLTPREFVTLSARLAGLKRGQVGSRTETVLKQVGIAYAADRQARRLSKGMLQRAGLAAALVGDPQLLMLDEPMSGLDPVGRKEVRDLILEERSAGRTLFFSTHILTDVETLCDRVAILRKGHVVVRGTLTELLKRDVKRTDVTLEQAGEEFDTHCKVQGLKSHRLRHRLVIEVEGEQPLRELLRLAVQRDVLVREVVPRHETLEELFVREAIEHPIGDATTRASA
ncbi:MAG: hypothetical protein RJA70_4213 [Pseudomonadota bacterium]|jgi:ABC-2 type transport system ATP-binding protein